MLMYIYFILYNAIYSSWQLKENCCTEQLVNSDVIYIRTYKATIISRLKHCIRVLSIAVEQALQ